LSTNCVFPPELDDKQLLAFLDDPKANRETALHLEKCSHCREKAEALDRLQKRMTSRLYRITCPSPIELGEYHLQMLPDPQRMVIGQHLRECPHCAREISELEEFMNDLAPQSGLLKSVKALIARLVSGQEGGEDFVGSTQVPAFMGLRGEGEEPFIYQANGIQIVIEVLDDVEHPGRKTLLGLITGLKPNGFMIEAYQGGKVVATTLVDEIGNFILGNFLPGSYELILRGSDTEIHIQSFIV
jgi:hypothetical protein